MSADKAVSLRANTMRTSLALLLFVFLAATQAFEWRSDLYHCTASLPDSTGWQPVEAPKTPGITTLIVVQNSAKQAVFGINIVEKLPGTHVSEPAVQQAIEVLLRKFGYQFAGHSTVSVSGLDWIQYQVRSGAGAQLTTGVVRFAAAGGYFFGITMLRGGGQEAAQDAELQRAAASFRIVQAMSPAPAVAEKQATAPAPAAVNEKRQSPTADEPAAPDNSTRQMIWIGGGALLVLIFLIKIIGSAGGQSGER